MAIFAKHVFDNSKDIVVTAICKDLRDYKNAGRSRYHLATVTVE
ncbi:hypothetical protein [Chitinophaga sp. CF118]|nr:hypothetical protein [Chitinophaga sp. CF118]